MNIVGSILLRKIKLEKCTFSEYLFMFVMFVDMEVVQICIVIRVPKSKIVIYMSVGL